MPHVVLIRALVAEEEPFAAVGHVDKDRPVAPLLRHEQVDVRGKLDLTFGVARRFVEIDDDAVVRIRGIDDEIRPPLNALVRAGEAE